MSLQVVDDLDPDTLFSGGNYGANGGFFLFATAGLFKPNAYYDRLDIGISRWSNGTGIPASDQVCQFDPLLLDNTGALFTTAPDPVENSLAVGYWDRSLNEQKIYNFSSAAAAANPFIEVNPLSLDQVLASDPFPLVGTGKTRSALTIGQAGYYEKVEGGWIFFEGWSGGNALVFNADVTHTDLVTYENVTAVVDLTTGAATIIDMPSAYGNPPLAGHQFSQPQLFGQDVTFRWPQFVQDDSSSSAAPRGEVWVFAEGTTSPADSGNFRRWIKVFDWNPLGISGTPSRVHLRERLVSAADFIKSTPASTSGVHESGSSLTAMMFYHPRSNQIIQYSSIAADLALDPGETKFIRVAPTPGVDIITNPSARERIATGKTIDFSVEALGTFSEKIGGIDMVFALTRESTVGEVLSTTPTPGETVTLANTVSPTDPGESPISVYEDGTKLTETTHYTLNRGASQITFVGPKPLAGGEVYTADYRHFGTNLTPAHGTLRNLTATTDVNGEALARVDAPDEDPVKDRWDDLDATQAP